MPSTKEYVCTLRERLSTPVHNGLMCQRRNVVYRAVRGSGSDQAVDVQSGHVHEKAFGDARRDY